MTLGLLIVLMLAAVAVLTLALFVHWLRTAPLMCDLCGREGCDGSRAVCPERWL